MGLVFTLLDVDVFGKHYAHIFDVTLDSAYPAGGYAINPKYLGLSEVRGIQVLAANAAGSILRPTWDRVNKKLVINLGGGGILPYSPGGGDIKGSTNTNSENADAAGGGTNGALVSTSAAVSTLVAGALVIAAQPDVARNLLMQFENTTGGALNLFEGVSTFAVVGKFRGAAQTENITFTSTAGNKSVAAAKFRLKYGVKPFDSVTSITLTNLPAATLNVMAGIGSKLGLPANPATGVDADMIKFTRTAADLAVAGLTDFTNNTVNFDTLADGNDVGIVYRASAEAPNGGNLGASILRLLFLGA